MVGGTVGARTVRGMNAHNSRLSGRPDGHTFMDQLAESVPGAESRKRLCSAPDEYGSRLHTSLRLVVAESRDQLQLFREAAEDVEECFSASISDNRSLRERLADQERSLMAARAELTSCISEKQALQERIESQDQKYLKEFFSIGVSKTIAGPGLPGRPRPRMPDPKDSHRQVHGLARRALPKPDKQDDLSESPGHRQACRMAVQPALGRKIFCRSERAAGEEAAGDARIPLVLGMI